MNTDFRIATDFWNHPKTGRLTRAAGLEGVRSLQMLWGWVARNRPDGNLTGMNPDDIEFVADWHGEPGLFFQSIVTDWLDRAEGTENSYLLHDWHEHNQWASKADERSDKARFSRLCREKPELGRQLSESGITKISKEDYELYTSDALPIYDRTTIVERPLYDSATPAPEPAPVPTLRNKEEPEGSLSGKADGADHPPDTSASVKTRKGGNIPYATIVAHLNKQTGKAFKPSNKATRRLIQARWKEGARLEDFKAVIDGRLMAWGADPQMNSYLRPQTLFGPKFESYLQADRRTSQALSTSGATPSRGTATIAADDTNYAPLVEGVRACVNGKDWGTMCADFVLSLDRGGAVIPQQVKKLYRSGKLVVTGNGPTMACA